MTDDRMALIELIEKGADGDLVRDLLGVAMRPITVLAEAAPIARSLPSATRVPVGAEPPTPELLLQTGIAVGDRWPGSATNRDGGTRNRRRIPS